ncbi:phage infection protein [Pseudomonas sp. MAC6]|uniref:phage infection protein n=1 Tax=Pseudomonas sp. MAC6 TaxID=3401633 RepID=UPI003BF5A886
MKKQILTAVILSSLSINAFALPQNNPQPLLGEKQDSSVKTLMGFGNNLQTEGGADRQQERLRVAESSADRTYRPQTEHIHIAESSADRIYTPQMEHLRVAESSSDRTYKPQTEHMHVAESSADRTYKPQIPGQTA